MVGSYSDRLLSGTNTVQGHARLLLSEGCTRHYWEGVLKLWMGWGVYPLLRQLIQLAHQR